MFAGTTRKADLSTNLPSPPAPPSTNQKTQKSMISLSHMRIPSYSLPISKTVANSLKSTSLASTPHRLSLLNPAIRASKSTKAAQLTTRDLTATALFRLNLPHL